MNDLKNRLWYILTSFLQILLGIIFVFFTSKFISPSEFGKMAIYLSVISLIEVVLVDINVFGIYRTNRESYFIGRILSRILIFTLLGSIPVIFSSNLEYLLVLIICGLKPIYIYFDSLAVKNNNTRKLFITDISCLILSHIYVYFYLEETSSSVLLLSALLVRFSLFNILMFSRSNIPIRLYFKQRLFSRMTILNFAAIFRLKTDYLSISWNFGSTNLGFYTKAYQVNSYATQTFGKMLFNFGLKRNTPLQPRSIFNILILGSIFSFLLSLITDEIVAVILGPGWEKAAGLMAKLVFLIPFTLLSKVLATEWLRNKKTSGLTKFYFSHGIIIIGLFYFLKNLDLAVNMLLLSHIIAALYLFYFRREQ